MKGTRVVNGTETRVRASLAAKSFDEILAPIRRAFQETGMSEAALDALFEEAREEAYQERKAREQ